MKLYRLLQSSGSHIFSPLPLQACIMNFLIFQMEVYCKKRPLRKPCNSISDNC